MGKLPQTRSALRDRLGIALAVLMVLALFFMMFDGAVRNGQCSFWQFITFQCNRWDAAFKPWK